MKHFHFDFVTVCLGIIVEACFHYPSNPIQFNSSQSNPISNTFHKQMELMADWLERAFSF